MLASKSSTTNFILINPIIDLYKSTTTILQLIWLSCLKKQEQSTIIRLSSDRNEIQCSWVGERNRWTTGLFCGFEYLSVYTLVTTNHMRGCILVVHNLNTFHRQTWSHRKQVNINMVLCSNWLVFGLWKWRFIVSKTNTIKEVRNSYECVLLLRVYVAWIVADKA